MAGKIDICNLSLSHLGANAAVQSIDPPDGSAEAGYCAQFYDIARREALEADGWLFAKTRKALVQTVNPSTVWQYAYQKPSDCVMANRILQLQYVQQLLWWPFSPVVTADEVQTWDERGSAAFEIEGDIILCNEPDAVLLYIKDVTDTTKFTSSFVTFLSYLLSSYLAGPIVRGDAGASTAARLRQVAARVLGEAATRSANQSTETTDFVPTHMRVR